MFYLNELVSLKNLDKKKLSAAIDNLIDVYKISDKALSITFCGNKYIQKLNKEFLKKDSATDVLSFPMFEKSTLGDIFISLAKARENSVKYHNTLLAEVLYLVIHGICHLLGDDHHNKKTVIKMRINENIGLNKLLESGIVIKGRI
jgi:probable rRNA maturation factor